MNPAYIYFKEINIDQDETFTADFSKKNGIENVVFNKENEYRIIGLNINSIVPDSKILKIENEKEQKKIIEEIQELIKAYKEPDLTLTVSNTETKTIKIPFVKKMKVIFLKKKSYFNHPIDKNEDFYVYDYVGHLKRFGFLWVDTRLGLVFEVTIVSNKLRKQLTMSRNERKEIVVDESEVWNMNKTWKKDSSALDKSRICFSEGYLFFENEIKSEFNLNGDSFDFTKLSKREKTVKIVSYLKKFHDSKLNGRGYSYFFHFILPHMHQLFL